MRAVIFSVAVLGLAAISFAQSELVTRQSVEPVAVAAQQRLGLEEAYEAEADFSEIGRVDVLNNGLIIVKIPATVYYDENDELQATPKEVVAFQTKKAFPHNGDLRAIMTFEDAVFDIVHNDEDITLTVSTAEGLIMQFNVNQAANAQEGPSCSVSCGPDDTSECNQTCPLNKACIAYCDGITAVCNCVPEPKPKKANAVLQHAGQAQLPQ